MIAKPPTPIYVPHIYYLPLKYAANLVLNRNFAKQVAITLTIHKYARYGCRNQKKLKGFHRREFERYLDAILDNPHSYLVRKSSKHC